MESITKLGNINKTNLRDEIYLSLKRSILTGEINQGQSLTINQICKLTKFSATPIREALLKLEQDGIVSRLPNGNFVVRRFSKEEIENILELRILLETFAMEKAIKFVGPEDINWLLENVKKSEERILKGEIIMALDWMPRDNEEKDHALHRNPYWTTEAPGVTYEKKQLIDPKGNVVEGLYTAWITLNNPKQYNI